MEDYLEEFLFTKSKLTQVHYTCDLNHFRKWSKGNNIPEDINRIRFLDVQRYLKTLEHCPSTRRKIISLKSFFHYLHLSDYITKDILKCLKVPAATKCRVERKLTEAEVFGMYEKAKGKVNMPRKVDSKVGRFVRGYIICAWTEVRVKVVIHLDSLGIC